MNDKEIIRKLLKLAEKQQKIITKIAQATETEDQKKARWESERSKLVRKEDFSYGKLSQDNPYRYDPLYAGEMPSTSTPSTAPATQIAKQPQAPVSKPTEVAMQAGHSMGLGSDLVAQLQSGAPALKGLVQIKQNGKFLDVNYNADIVRGKLNLSASDVKRILTNAVAPKFQIANVIGMTNPGSDFVPNWS